MPKSLEEIWDEFGLKLKQFINRQVRDESVADDILQEVFLKIHSSLVNLKDEDKLESWLYQITRHTMIDHLRRQRKEQELPEEWEAGQNEHENEAIEKLAPSIKAMILMLPQKYKEALVLTEYQGLTHRQLADKLGISLTAAKSRVQRGRQKLKEMLLACCHFELDKRGKVIDYYPRCACCAKEGCKPEK